MSLLALRGPCAAADDVCRRVDVIRPEENSWRLKQLIIFLVYCITVTARLCPELLAQGTQASSGRC
jgi:hypothetical protein